MRGRANRGEMLSKWAAVVERSCRSRFHEEDGNDEADSFFSETAAAGAESYDQ